MKKLSILFISLFLILTACNNISDKKRCEECFKEFDISLKELDRKADSVDIFNLDIKQQQCSKYFEDAKNEFNEDELKEYTIKLEDSKEVVELIKNYN